MRRVRFAAIATLVNKIRKWWKFGIAILLTLIALQVGISLSVRGARTRAFLTRQLEKSFGRSVEVRSYSASLFPTPQLDAEGITVGEDPAFGREYFLRAERLSAGLRWIGLLRGRFELGTLQLDSPTVLFTRNAEGRWNLERWLPSAPVVSSTPAASQLTPAHHLQKLEISDGRVSFKLGDDKMPFAFIQLQGSVEQVAPGRWQLNLRAVPWRSGVPLQLAGTVRLRGDVAGTSVRLQPARFQISWGKSSLADLFRLISGQDNGLRGLFSAEASAESSGASVANDGSAPGDWNFSLQARATGIHRWDLTERDDNPRVGLKLNGRWNPGAGTAAARELVIEAPRSNLRGTALLTSLPGSALELRIDSAGIQAADLLAWFRAFQPGVAEGIRGNQSFTGAATLRGWPLELSEVAFSSPRGTWTVPGFASPVEVRALRGGMQKRKLVIEPFAVSIPASRNASAEQAAGASGRLTAARLAGVVNVSLTHSFESAAGDIGLTGQVNDVTDLFRIADAFGRHLQNGWELQGKANGDLHWAWQSGKARVWNGRADVSQATLQVAGLNQPVQLASVRGEWRNATRKFTLAKVSAFGASWTGSVEQTANPPSEFATPEVPAWAFHLQADHLDAADLDRWIGPRARPGWLQRLLPAGLGGASSAPVPSAILARIRAEGELRVDELTIEKVRLKQFRTDATLAALKLSLRNAQAQWAGGEIRGSAEAAFSAKPRYDVSTTFERVSLVQLPWLTSLSDRLTGTAAGSFQLRADGIGREPLLESLSGKGEIRLNRVELRGWDLAGTMADGEWKQGISRWASGAGTFHLSDGGFDLNSLRLISPSEEFSMKGSVSFSQDTDLTAESRLIGNSSRINSAQRFLQISGPLAEPRVSLQKAGVQQPGD